MRPGETAERWPGDELPTVGVHHWHRGVDVDASAETTFRWVCQLKVAPYSYDWIDNLGRRSPRELSPGLEGLALDQRFMVMFRLVDFVEGEHLTLETGSRIFGRLWVTYRVVAEKEGTRLLARLRVPIRQGVGHLLNRGLCWGDWVMMRKQLLTLAKYAERI